MFEIFKKKQTTVELEPLSCGDEELVALADGKLTDVSQVSDPVFVGEVMGESAAFQYEQDKVVLCAPANGILEVLFPTGHAFGIRMNNGVGLLVHIGVNTVEANGAGFRLLGHKQGDRVRAGEPVVEVNYGKLRKTYDMSTMLIVTEGNGKKVHFRKSGEVKRGEKVTE